jgi:hypothetical protein
MIFDFFISTFVYDLNNILMKLQTLFLSAACALLLLTGCEQENVETQDLTASMTAQFNLAADKQAPMAQFDASENGLFTGIFVAGTGIERGELFINLGNNSKYDAVAKMIGGERIIFKRVDQSNEVKENLYFFKAANASFIVTINGQSAVITDAQKDNNLFFGVASKATSGGGIPINRTGTFIDPSAPGFTGTWNLIADGTNPDPNGLGGSEGITKVVITHGNSMYTDTSFENFDNGCSLPDNFVPELYINFVYALGQSSNSFNGVSNWSLNWVNSYTDETCQSLLSGSFSWTKAGGGATRTGQLFVD